MQNASDSFMYYTGDLVFQEEPEWDPFLKGYEVYAQRRARGATGRCGPLMLGRATLDGDGMCRVPFTGDCFMNMFRTEDNKNVPMSHEEAREEFFSDLADDLWVFFGCEVDLRELVPSFACQEDLEAIEAHLVSARENHGYYGMPLFGTKDIKLLPEEQRAAGAMAELVKAMEDSHDEFICILAGYPKPMERMIDVNPGLRDRIAFYVDFPDYTADELMDVLRIFVKKDKFRLSSAAAAKLRECIGGIVENKDENFSNARIIRKVYERVRMAHMAASKSSVIGVSAVERAFSDSDLASLMATSPASGTGFC